jgi:SAM-dependent methyltransferase
MCHGALVVDGGHHSCTACGRVYSSRNGFPDFVLIERFNDVIEESQKAYEEKANENSTRNYWLPLFRRTWKTNGAPPRLLSLGCGIASDVDLLTEAGFDCYGIDCGNRDSAWIRRRHPERLLLANGQHLPFPDACFDGVFCGCVFPHVGVEGDSRKCRPDVKQVRQQLALEMCRVLKPGGRIFVSSPNRYFPFDIFHGREAGGYRPLLNLPGSHFLLSLGDYRRLFAKGGCVRVQALPVNGYWGFVRAKTSLKGRLLALPVRGIFWLVSQRMGSWLRGLPLSPWLVLMAEKPR